MEQPLIYRRGMKTKTIKSVLRKKIDQWLSTIGDEKVKELAKKNTIVTGGCIASMLLGEKINDFDLYFTNKETVSALAHYYVKKFQTKKAEGISVKTYVDETETRVRILIKSAGISSEEGTEKPYQYFEGEPEGNAQGYVSEIMQDPGHIEDAYQETEEKVLEAEEDGKPEYRPVFLSTNAITLSGRLQLILRFFGDADQIHENYDFVHCTNYWESHNNQLTLRQPALESLLARELKYVGSKYPICSLIRLRKFIHRGWTINAGQMLKIMMQVSELDLKNVSILEDQLTGVDVAYFVEVVEKLKEKDPEKVNSAYLVEIIDRMF